MKYDLSNIIDREKFKNKVANAMKKGDFVNFSTTKQSRTIKMNRCLHLFCEICSDELNAIGKTLNYEPRCNIDSNEPIELMFTPELFKEHIWRDIQIQLFGKYSTKELTNKECSHVADVVILMMSKFEIVVTWPNLEDYINK